LLLIAPAFLFGQEEVHASEEASHCYMIEKSWSIGLAAPYSFNIDGVGINTRLYYNVGHELCFGPEFSYFKNDHKEIIDVDFVVHYIFEIPVLGVFPLAGLNYTWENFNNHNESALGIVVGGGLHRNFGKVSLFAEYAHVQSKLSDDFVTLGLFYTLK